MMNKIIEALAVCLADQYGETVTATITKGKEYEHTADDHNTDTRGNT